MSQDSATELAYNVLYFYAFEDNWRSPSTGFASQYDPAPSQIELDQGARARQALRLLDAMKGNRVGLSPIGTETKV